MDGCLWLDVRLLGLNTVLATSQGKFIPEHVISSFENDWMQYSKLSFLSRIFRDMFLI
jgi:hypothetical protein